MERTPAGGGATLPRPVQGDVRFEAVNFSYSHGRHALTDISLHARPGEIIALVGPTGSGKSTIANLLLGFYTPDAGRIRIDGVDIATLPLDMLRGQIALVSQEGFLFNGTVRENIRYGKLDASEADLLAAASAANCHDFIARLPRGYETEVGERGEHERRELPFPAQPYGRNVTQIPSGNNAGYRHPRPVSRRRPAHA